jgi:hypothetical protein
MALRESIVPRARNGNLSVTFRLIGPMVRCKGADTAAARIATDMRTVPENHVVKAAKKEGSMRSKKWPIVILTFAFGTLFGWQLAIYSQTNADSLRKLAEERKDLTKMEWVLVNARLNALESPVIRYSSSPIMSAGYEFDSSKGRIVASAFVPPEWFAKTNLEKAKESLTSSAVDLCGTSAGIALIKQSSPAAMDWRNACSVRFFTWTLGKPEGISAKDIALFEEGRLVLK